MFPSTFESPKNSARNSRHFLPTRTWAGSSVSLSPQAWMGCVECLSQLAWYSSHRVSYARLPVFWTLARISHMFSGLCRVSAQSMYRSFIVWQNIFDLYMRWNHIVGYNEPRYRLAKTLPSVKTPAPAIRCHIYYTCPFTGHHPSWNYLVDMTFSASPITENDNVRNVRRRNLARFENSCHIKQFGTEPGNTVCYL